MPDNRQLNEQIQVKRTKAEEKEKKNIHRKLKTRPSVKLNLPGVNYSFILCGATLAISTVVIVVVIIDRTFQLSLIKLSLIVWLFAWKKCVLSGVESLDGDTERPVLYDMHRYTYSYIRLRLNITITFIGIYQKLLTPSMCLWQIENSEFRIVYFYFANYFLLIMTLLLILWRTEFLVKISLQIYMNLIPLRQLWQTGRGKRRKEEIK